MNLEIENAVVVFEYVSREHLDQYSELRSIAGKKVIEHSESFRHSMLAYEPLRPFVLR